MYKLLCGLSAIAARDHATLAVLLDAKGIVHSRYRTMLDAANDRVLVAENPIFGTVENPSGAHYPAAGAFATIPQIDRQPPLPAPRNGEHSEQVLADRLGLPSKQIAHLIDAGIVGVPATGS